MEMQNKPTERGQALAETTDWAELVAELSDTDRIKLTGVIAGMQLAQSARLGPGSPGQASA